MPGEGSGTSGDRGAPAARQSKVAPPQFNAAIGFSQGEAEAKVQGDPESRGTIFQWPIKALIGDVSERLQKAL